MKLYDVPAIGGKMYLRDETDLWGFLQNNEYEPQETELVKKIVKPDMVCLDIGANIGYYSILMGKLGAEVYAYEPEPTNFELLQKNVKENNLDRVNCKNYALSPSSKNDTLYLCDASHGMHRMFKSRFCDKSIKVNIASIHPDHDCDFVKIDVEGSEKDVLQVLYGCIQNKRPIMLIEFHPPTFEEKGDDPESIYLLIKKALDYEIYLVPDTTNPISYEELYKQTNNESGGQNILCLPK